MTPDDAMHIANDGVAKALHKVQRQYGPFDPEDVAGVLIGQITIILCNDRPLAAALRFIHERCNQLAVHSMEHPDQATAAGIDLDLGDIRTPEARGIHADEYVPHTFADGEQGYLINERGVLRLAMSSDSRVCDQMRSHLIDALMAYRKSEVAAGHQAFDIVRAKMGLL
jgi:hypothetical protein